MITPIKSGKHETDSGRQVMDMLLTTLRGKGVSREAARAETPEQFQTQLMRLGKEEHIKIQRGSCQPLDNAPEEICRMAQSRAKAVLRAGDWVIFHRAGAEGPEYDLAYGLEGETVLLAGGRRLPLSRWQEEARRYWFVTLTFSRPKRPVPGEPLGRAETCWLQRRLNLQLGTQLAVDGDFGPETAEAAEQFRKKRRRKTGFCEDPLEEELAEFLDLTGAPC